MIPLDDWMVVEKEVTKITNNIIVPENVRDKTSIEVGDIFVAKKLGPQAEGRIEIGDRLLFYGVATVMSLKLTNGKQVWVGRAADVAFKLEEGD